MIHPSSFSARKARFLNSLHARLAARVQTATAFVTAPEPRTIGSFAKGRQLLAGNYLFAGHLITAPGTVLWDLAPPEAAYEQEMHGFGWLDDQASIPGRRHFHSAQSNPKATLRLGHAP